MKRVGYVGRTIKRYERAIYPTPTPNPWLTTADISTKAPGYPTRTWAGRRDTLTEVGSKRVAAVQRANAKIMDDMVAKVLG